MNQGKPVYKRILLKLSGEALARGGKPGEILNYDFVSQICDVIKECTDMGVQVGIVVGGGNIWRGRQGGKMDRTRADHMGICLPVRNGDAIAVQLGGAAGGGVAAVGGEIDGAARGNINGEGKFLRIDAAFRRESEYRGFRGHRGGGAFGGNGGCGGGVVSAAGQKQHQKRLHHSHFVLLEYFRCKLH